MICALYFNFKYFKKTQIRNKMVNKIKLKSKCFNLLCEYKNREHFDVILRGQMCTDQTQLKSGHTRKPQNQKPNYCCRLQFSFSHLIGFYLATQKHFVNTSGVQGVLSFTLSIKINAACKIFYCRLFHSRKNA